MDFFNLANVYLLSQQALWLRSTFWSHFYRERPPQANFFLDRSKTNEQKNNTPVSRDLIFEIKQGF